MSFGFVESSTIEWFYELESHLNRYLLSMAQYRSLLKVDGVFYAKYSLYIYITVNSCVVEAFTNDIDLCKAIIRGTSDILAEDFVS